MPYVRTLSARFSITDIAAVIVHKYYLVIVVFFVMRWALLTDTQRQLLYWLRSADIRTVIKIRALGAENFLLPWMARGNSINTSDTYLELTSELNKQLSEAKHDPNKLLLDTIEIISTKPLLAMIYRLLPYLQSKDKLWQATQIIKELTDTPIDANEAIVIDSSIIIEEIDSVDDSVALELENEKVVDARASKSTTDPRMNSSDISIIFDKVLMILNLTKIHTALDTQSRAFKKHKIT